MTTRRWTLLATFLVAALTAAMLTTDKRPLIYADELVTESSRWRGETVAVRGIVYPRSHLKRSDADVWQFRLAWQGRGVPVTYTGLVPSTFVDGADAVVTGRLVNGEFLADDLLVRIPED